MNKEELDYLDDILINEPMTLVKRMIIECIKEKILKEQEQAQILEILRKKKVDIEYLSKCNNIKEYNAHWCYEKFHLTEEEFKLLKRYFNE